MRLMIFKRVLGKLLFILFIKSVMTELFYFNDVRNVKTSVLKIENWETPKCAKNAFHNSMLYQERVPK